MGEGVIVGRVNSLRPSHLVLVAEGLTMWPRVVHRQGRGIWQERETHSWGGRCLQLVAAVMGAGKEGVK